MPAAPRDPHTQALLSAARELSKAGAPHRAQGRVPSPVNLPAGCHFHTRCVYENALVWKSWGATETDAMRAMLPMARGTIASIESAGIARGMPGPVSRGDVGSVERYVESWRDKGEDMLRF